MSSLDDPLDAPKNPATIKMPAPPKLNSQQATIAALGLEELVAKGRAAGIEFTFKISEKGDLEVEILGDWTLRESERIARFLTIKRHNPSTPEHTITMEDDYGIAMSPADWLDASRESRETPVRTDAPVKLWTGKVRGKRSKSKSGAPDLD